MTTSNEVFTSSRKLTKESPPISSEGLGGIGPAGIAQGFLLRSRMLPLL